MTGLIGSQLGLPPGSQTCAEQMTEVLDFKRRFEPKGLAVVGVTAFAAEQLGILGVVLHPGAHMGSGEDIGIARISAGLNKAHAATSGFKTLTLLETTAGQGTALVGVLDPFWDSKGYVTPEAYRRFAGTTVPLARLERRVFTTAEALSAEIEVARREIPAEVARLEKERDQAKNDQQRQDGVHVGPGHAVN